MVETRHTLNFVIDNISNLGSDRNMFGTDGTTSQIFDYMYNNALDDDQLGKIEDDCLHFSWGKQKLHGRDPRKSIMVYSKHLFWPLDPRIEEITVADILHGLSTEPRYGNHCPIPYYVGQHSYLLYTIVPEKFRKWAIIHDATEAYMKDLPRPLKHNQLFSFYRDAETTLSLMIADKFGIPSLEDDAEFKHWDTTIAHAEMLYYFGTDGIARFKALGYGREYLDEIVHYAKTLPFDASVTRAYKNLKKVMEAEFDLAQVSKNEIGQN